MARLEQARVSQCARVAAAYINPGQARPVTAFGTPADDRAAGGRLASASAWRHQWIRTGFGAIAIQRAESRASTRVARFHSTPQPSRNRHQRSRSIPYERIVEAGREHA
ncbi:hypothetical protein ACGFYQ_39090 [Streptomyces sp. NPDC048258]|uniref:hypothetical protein n=1 Tax=Streptomyces sp. NPDC048258 TaxID=3365527 RepID=UPI0037149CE3